jgi:tRNA1Val (adenine37-N6)-methyltransferase
MPNQYFQFKQFIIQQHKTAMKVCTDACLFGAWLADKLYTKQITARNILDIGTGTGLLSLLLAQKATVNIDAVEIDKAAAQQALENFSSSPFSTQLHLYPVSFQNFTANTKNKYDLILSNPPFFENDLKSSEAGKNLSKHEDNLSLTSILALSKTLLKPGANIALLLPATRLPQLLTLTKQQHLYCNYILMVKQTPAHKPFRVCSILNEKQTALTEEEIIIKTKDGAYTNAFTQLLKDYYLYL